MKKADIKPNSVYYVSQGAYNPNSNHQNIRSGYILTGDTIEWMPMWGGETAESIKYNKETGSQFAYLDPSDFTVVTPDHTAMAFLAIDDVEVIIDTIVDAHGAGSEGYRAVRDALRTRFPRAMGSSRMRCDHLRSRIHVKQVEREIDQSEMWAKAQADADADAQRVIDKAAQDVAYEHYHVWHEAEYEANVMPVVQEALRRIPQGFMTACKDTRRGELLLSKIDDALSTDHVGDTMEALYSDWGVSLKTDSDGNNPSVIFGSGRMSSNGSEVEIGMSFSTMLAMAAAWKTVYGHRTADEVAAEFAPTFDLTRPPAEARA
jgi:hypothetical protein